MGLFKKASPEKARTEVQRAAAIEIVAHKDAKEEVMQESRQVQERLNSLLEENGFTLKIYLAAGGKRGTHHT